MRKILLVLILIALFSSCVINIPRNPTVDCECCEEKILQIADAAMRYRGMSRFDITQYERTIIEEETFFLINYSRPLDGRLILGGGGEIKISKETCEIIEKKFYQ